MNRWNDSSIQDQNDNYLFSGYSVQKSLTIVILAVLNLPLREFYKTEERRARAYVASLLSTANGFTP